MNYKWILQFERRCYLEQKIRYFQKMHIFLINWILSSKLLLLLWKKCAEAVAAGS